jgi:hypothetical protein
LRVTAALPAHSVISQTRVSAAVDDGERPQ